MRDEHRMKEKYELSLDTRQVASLAIGGVVVLGAVFVLGVVVGKKLGGDAGAANAPDLLSALDARAEALERIAPDAAESTLTFQDELTRQMPDAAVPSPPAAAEVLEEPPPPPRAPKAPEPSPKLAEAPEGADAAVPTRTAAPSDLRAAIARAAVPAETAAAGAFTLQLSASQDRAEADRFAAGLRGRGYAPYIVEATVPGRGTWYRVRLGRFASRDAAAEYLEDFRRETRLEAFVAGGE